MTQIIELASLVKVVARPDTIPLVHDLCPGCGEPLAYRAVVEALEAVTGDSRPVMVSGIGCSGGLTSQARIDSMKALHGRAPSLATGIKRVRPDALVFTFQGDGDMLNEGLQEVMHAAARAEPITLFLINNACFGETGGQMTVTSLPGQRTKSTPQGRGPGDGTPIRICELLSQFEGVAYAARSSVSSPQDFGRARRYAQRALQLQKDGAGMTFVEFLTMCPSGWAMSTIEATKWIDNEMVKYYPLGEIKVPAANER